MIWERYLKNCPSPLFYIVFILNVCTWDFGIVYQFVRFQMIVYSFSTHVTWMPPVGALLAKQKMFVSCTLSEGCFFTTHTTRTKQNSHRTNLRSSINLLISSKFGMTKSITFVMRIYHLLHNYIMQYNVMQ